MDSNKRNHEDSTVDVDEPSEKRMNGLPSANENTNDASSSKKEVISGDNVDMKTASPLALLSKEDCQVQTLTVSDQHATLLLTNDNDNDNDNDDENEHLPKKRKKSLLKLTLIPFHKTILGSNPIVTESSTSNNDKTCDAKDTEKNESNASSDKIVKFLKGFQFQLKSESGAEYSYYRASPNSNVNSTKDDQNTMIVSPALTKKNDLEEEEEDTDVVGGSFDVELISPANERQISRAMPSSGSILVHESPELYNNIVRPYIQSIVDNGKSLSWIHNIIEIKKEQERLLVNHPQFIMNIDTKWRSHPDPLTVPRKEWFQHKAVEDLYCLGITKEKGIASLRDLTADHVPMLQSMIDEGYKAIETIYGVESNQIRVFVHYQPQFYHFHVHFTRLENEVGSTVERGHLLTDIIQNLQMDPLYYSKRTIVYKLRKMSPLHTLMENNDNSNETENVDSLKDKQTLA